MNEKSSQATINKSNDNSDIKSNNDNITTDIYKKKYIKYLNKYKNIKNHNHCQQGGKICFTNGQCDKGDVCDHRQNLIGPVMGHQTHYGPVGRCVSKAEYEQSHKCNIM